LEEDDVVEELLNEVKFWEDDRLESPDCPDRLPPKADTPEPVLNPPVLKPNPLLPPIELELNELMFTELNTGPDPVVVEVKVVVLEIELVDPADPITHCPSLVRVKPG